jgi:hypothetical protein
MMDSFDLKEPIPKRPGPTLPRVGFWDILTIGVLLVTACMLGYFLLVFLNPNSPINLLKPNQTLIPTPTITPLQLEATWTPTATIYFSPTATLLPSITPPATVTVPNFTPATDTPAATDTPQNTPTPKAEFSATSVNAVENIIFPHLQEAACNWMGVAGTVDDQNNSPIVGVIVVLRGTLNGKSVDLINVSGVNKEYGPSGFEFVLANEPIASNDSVYVQLLDQTTNVPLSEKIYIDTYNDCEKNLLLVRFKKNR